MSNELKELDILDILVSVSTGSGPGLGEFPQIEEVVLIARGKSYKE